MSAGRVAISGQPGKWMSRSKANWLIAARKAEWTVGGAELRILSAPDPADNGQTATWSPVSPARTSAVGPPKYVMNGGMVNRCR